MAAEIYIVYVSAHAGDAVWRDRVEQALMRSATVMRSAEVGASPNLRNADIAVVLLSPLYLDDQGCRAELRTIFERMLTGRMRLIPVVVSACEWQSVEHLAAFNIFAAQNPLDTLTTTQLDGALKNIASDLAELAQWLPDLSRSSASPTSGATPQGGDFPPKPEFAFSEGAELAINGARKLAKDSGRPGLTSSCLLFGLADCGLNPNDTATLIRLLMDHDGRYVVARDEFLNDARDAAGSNTNEIAGIGKVSLNTRAIIETAAQLATRTRVKSGQIHQRHLLAAIALPSGSDSASHAQRRLGALRLNMSTICEELFRHIRDDPRGEDLAEWSRILRPNRTPPSEPATSGHATSARPAADPFLSGPAGYTSEFVGVGGTYAVPDHLGVEGQAHRLAELIALKETKLPLAIGLFGNWGSGKSHFMNLMDRHMKAVSEKCKKEGGPWCREIVPIYFNAWHYLDANLWASLVTQIFDGLIAHLQPKGNALEVVRAQLKEAGGATALAEQEVASAQKAVEVATTALVQARANTESARAAVDGMLDNLLALAPQATKQAADQVKTWLGVEAEVATLSDLARKHRDVATWPGRVRELWNRVIAQPGRWWRLGWLAAVLIVVPVGVHLLLPYVGVLRNTLGRLGPEVRFVLLDAIAVVTWLSPRILSLNKQLGEMEALQAEAEQARKARAVTKEVIEAQNEVVKAEAAAVTAQSKLATARTLEAQLTQEAEALRPDRRLSSYIEGRARSADYRGQLGLVSLARRDFQELSDIFADRDAFEAKLSKLKDDPEKLKENPNAVAELQQLSDSIDRIVLFVDDLDRCQPEKVVDVLQAVHLLLAYPLFAVVVGVDQRALRQSLRNQLSGLLSEGDAERPATPLDYLEKIFHVPYHLPAMEKTGFETLMDKLTEPKKEVADTTRPPDPPAPTPTSTPTLTSTPTSTPSQTSSPTPTPTSAATPTSRPTPTATSTPTSSPTSTPPRVRVVGSVPLNDWERTALKAYHPLVRTPRGATRLLNTYRLLRAGIAEDHWNAFRGDGVATGEFRIAMLLLAAAAGSPAVAREWFNRLQKEEPRVLFDAAHSDKDEDPEWLKFKRVYLSTIGNVTPTRSKEDFVTWIDRVEQFAF